MYKCRRVRRKKEKEVKTLIIFNILTISLLLISSFVLVGFVNASNTPIKSVVFEPKLEIKKEYIVREKINEKIKSIKNRHMDYLTVITFYSNYTKNWNVSKVILEESLEANLPVNLAFALARIESGFNPKAFNRNSNGTADRGLFQLNDSYRQHWTIEEFYDITKNTKEGISYLLYCIDNTSSIPNAFGAYNAGLSRVSNLPKATERYIEKILVYEDELNIDFNKKVMERL